MNVSVLSSQREAERGWTTELKATTHHLELKALSPRSRALCPGFLKK